MSSKKKQDQYSAGLVSKPFWFYEYKAYVDELVKGHSIDEIREHALQNNLFSAQKNTVSKKFSPVFHAVSCSSIRNGLGYFHTKVSFGTENYGFTVDYGG